MTRIIGSVPEARMRMRPVSPSSASARATAVTPVTAPGTARDTLYPNGSSAAYTVSSSFVSSRGFGFLLLRDELSEWRLASDRPDAWQVGASGARLDYLVAPGPATRGKTFY